MSGLFDFVLVTADLRASEESIDGKSSIIGRILERSVDRAAADEEIAKIVEESRTKQQKIYEEKFKAQLEVMNLYRERGVNPVSGCFPLLIQMPFLIGMFDLLKSTFELRGASFIPGWIDNLTSPDVVFSWGYSIPLIGNQFHFPCP